jgi:hypothetical protein
MPPGPTGPEATAAPRSSTSLMKSASASAACSRLWLSISGWSSVRATIITRAHGGTTIQRFLPSIPSAIALPAIDSG